MRVEHVERGGEHARALEDAGEDPRPPEDLAVCFRAGRAITRFSAGSASKATEQAGSMIISSTATCTGISISGQPSMLGDDGAPAQPRSPVRAR